MKKYNFFFLTFFVFNFTVVKGQSIDNDSLYHIITKFDKQFSDYPNTQIVTLYDSEMPEGWYARLGIDTVKKILVAATSYVYKRKNKYLTNYYYLNEKVFATSTSKMLISDQNPDTYGEWTLQCLYKNDTLVTIRKVSNNEKFDFKEQLRIGYEIFNKFKFLYTSKKLLFNPKTKILYFQ